jgi:hypothetical protein
MDVASQFRRACGVADFKIMISFEDSSLVDWSFCILTLRIHMGLLTLLRRLKRSDREVCLLQQSLLPASPAELSQ